MSEETITFDLIRKIQIEEQKTSTLSRLPTNLFNATLDYIHQKKNVAVSDNRKDGLELRQVERLVQDIFDRRERKMINAAIMTARTSLPPENLADEERLFYKSLVNLIRSRRDELFKSMPNEGEAHPNAVFLQDMPSFMGIDEKTYGPFKKGDTATLPEENKKILVEKGVVEEIK